MTRSSKSRRDPRAGRQSSRMGWGNRTLRAKRRHVIATEMHPPEQMLLRRPDLATRLVQFMYRVVLTETGQDVRSHCLGCKQPRTSERNLVAVCASQLDNATSATLMFGVCAPCAPMTMRSTERASAAFKK